MVSQVHMAVSSQKVPLFPQKHVLNQLANRGWVMGPLQ